MLSQSLSRQAAILIFAGASIGWSALALPLSEASGEYRDIGTRLLRFGQFGEMASTRMLDSPVSGRLSPCDTYAQRAMLLLEMPLAEAALRKGTTKDFDRRVDALEGRVSRMLSCAPRDAFAWLTAFNLKALHGLQDVQNFDLLAASFEMSSNEAWIGVRRIAVATPHLLKAPEPLRAKILAEFEHLIRTGYVASAASAYLNAPGAVKRVLQQQVDQLSSDLQRGFTEAIQPYQVVTPRAL